METTKVAEIPAWAAPVEDLRLAVPRQEFDDRRSRVLGRMVDEGVDVAVFTTPASIFYLTGTKHGGLPPGPLVLARTGEYRYLIRMIDRGWQDVWASQSWASSWEPFHDSDDIDEMTAKAIRAIHANRIRRLGMELERQSISYDSVRRVMNLSGASEVVSVTDFVEDLRVVKSEAELALMRRAGEISKKAVDAVVAAIRGGSTDLDASLAATNIILREGGGHPNWPPFVFSGPSGETGHVPWIRRAPQPGEVVTWFLSGVVHDYYCPIERTILRLPDNSGVTEMIESVARTTEQLIKSIKPGMTGADAYDIAQESHRKAGFEKFHVNHAGYSVGINWSEFDIFRLRANEKRPLRAGMTFHLVPCLIVPGVGNICASKAVVLTDGGCEPLNDYPLRIEAFKN